jgi:hypothetical protein
MFGSRKSSRCIQVLYLFAEDIPLLFVKLNQSILQELTGKWVARRFGRRMRICLYLLQKFKGLYKGSQYINVGVMIELVYAAGGAQTCLRIEQVDVAVYIHAEVPCADLGRLTLLYNFFSLYRPTLG